VGVTRRILAVDGGGSKTDMVLADTDGRILVQVRGPSSQPQTHGLPNTLRVLDDLTERIRRETDLEPGAPLADFASVYLAGLDLPQEFEAIEPEVRSRNWASRLTLDNDTFALLRAGSQSRDAVAVICGTGINCVGRNAAGEHSRYLALGEISGDWGGGGELGTAALWYAARAEDGRGRPTALTAAVADHFGRPDIRQVSIALQLNEIDRDELNQLAPVVLALAEAGDQIAGDLVDRLADEMALLATVSMRRLDLLDRPVDLVLGGGVARSRDRRLMARLTTAAQAANPQVRTVVVDAPPVLGAVLLGLDALGATTEDAGQRLTQALTPLVGVTQAGW
jgi:N-acetylglucosamine kinase-like BadF-type ATPase